MGKFNSSLTRVQPVFKALRRWDRSGETWLVPLLAMAQCEGEAERAALPATLGRLVKSCWFEFPVDPPRSFLEWLINHPERLTGPPESEWKKWSKLTQKKRRALLAGHIAVRNEAVALLREPRCLPGRAWWRFEGVTRVDCALLTDSTAVFIEGKRTEVGPAKSVLWYSGRNQVLRVLDCAAAYAQRKHLQHYFVVLVVERNLVEQDAHRQAEIQAIMSPKLVRESLPHLTDDQRMGLLSHYLGATTWQAIVERFSLRPDVLVDKVNGRTRDS